MMTARQKQALYALLDQASAKGGTLEDLARRIGGGSRGNMHALIAGLKLRGLCTPAGDHNPRPSFSASAFRFIRADQLRVPEG